MYQQGKVNRVNRVCLREGPLEGLQERLGEMVFQQSSVNQLTGNGVCDHMSLCRPWNLSIPLWVLSLVDH